MKKRISEAAFDRACRVSRRRYSRLHVAGDGRLRIASPLPVEWHCIWFEANQVHEEDGAYYFDDQSYSVYMFIDSVVSVVFYVERGSVLSVSFSARLDVEQLRLAAGALEHAGLGRFIPSAARETLEHAPAEPLRAIAPELKRLARRSGGRNEKRAAGERVTTRRKRPG